MVDEPLQYFFDMNQDFQGAESNYAGNEVDFEEFLYDDNHTHTGAHLKIHLFPEAQNQILVRLENIADIFDKFNGTEDQTVYFNLNKYATNLWKNANSENEVVLNDIRIEERTLSNSDTFKTMQAQKHHWKTETVTPPQPNYPHDRPQNIVAL